MKLKNKRAQVASTLTWVVAFLIIFFIMFLFISFSITLAGKKIIAGKKDNLGIEQFETKLITNKKFVSFLNTRVEFEGEKRAVDLILILIEPYLDGQKDKGLQERNKEIAGKLNEVFDEPCNFYHIYYYNDMQDMIGKLTKSPRVKAMEFRPGMTPVKATLTDLAFPVSYKGYKINLKYKEDPEKCENVK